MTRDPKLFLVSYDVACDKRRRQVYLTLRGYGDHVQFSVFHCLLSPRQLATLVDLLSEQIHHAEDQVLIADLGQPDGGAWRRVSTMGLPLPHPERVVKVV